MITPETYGARRARVAGAIGEGAAFVLGAAPQLRVGQDTELRYVHDPDFWYLTGYAEPEAVLVLKPGDPAHAYTLFVRPRDRQKELWTGARGGVEAAREVFGASAAYEIGELPVVLPKLLADVDVLYARTGSDRAELDALITGAVVAARRSRPRSGSGPLTLIDPGLVLNEMRLKKEPGEIEAIREAARITVESFVEALACVRPGVGEWAIEATLEAAFRRRGASGPAFPTIAASGPNATVLHHIANDRLMNAGDWLLLDGGARANMYCADITRTFPVSGRFEGLAADVHAIVLAAHDAAIAAARPGATLDAVHDAALRVMVEGMVALGLLQGEPAALLEDKTKTGMFAPHKTSHWLGLDVHDVGDYVVGGSPRVLEPGMVFTVEPGLYVPLDAEAPAALRGIGVRIEDDVLITDMSCEVLTAALPTQPADLERLLN